MNYNEIQSINQLGSFYEISKYLEKNPEQFHKISDSLLERFKGVHVSEYSSQDAYKEISVGDLDRIVSSIFIQRENISKVELNLLRTLASSIFDRMDACLSDTLVQYQTTHILMIVCSPVEKLLQEDETLISKVEQFLYKVILDLYYPSSHVSELILEMRHIVSLKRILENLNDSSWFEEVYIHSCSEIWYQDAIILFKYVSDIFLNEDALLDFLQRYNKMIRETYAYLVDFNEISEKYDDYVGSDVSASMITECMRLLECDDVENETNKFLSSYANSTSIHYKIFECMLSDSSYLLNKIGRSPVNYEYVKNTSSTRWGKDIQLENTDDNSENEIAIEAVHKDSAKMNNAGKKIYKAYRNYKSAEEKVDSQISKAVSGMKNVITGDVRTEIIEGKKFSAISLLKRLLGTVAIFSVAPIKGAIGLVIQYALKKKTSVSERRKILMELDTEIEIITEKINDAKGDNNRQAKYAMMRTKKELENARQRIQYGLEADNKSIAGAKAVLSGVKNNFHK